MFNWKVLLVSVCMLCGSLRLSSAIEIETLWRDAYSASLRCDTAAQRNALIRLQELDRFELIGLPEKQRRVIALEIALIDNRRRTKVPGFTTLQVEHSEPMKKRKRRSKEAATNKEAGTLEVDMKAVEKSLLQKAEKAYRFGRLDEAKRSYQRVLKINAESDSARAGLQKVIAEME